jgi:RNA polymerase sigma-70 factor (ECF subfamily)
MSAQPQVDYETLSDVELAACVAMRDPIAVRLLMRRNNQRLFRAAWSILKDRAEAEDVVQSAYLKAFVALRSFKGQSSLTTWLTRIAINEALERRRAGLRRAARLSEPTVIVMDEYREKLMGGSTRAQPDATVATAELRKTLEAAIARLPEEFRLVLVLRDIEGLNVAEAAEALEIPAATIKTRLLRARRRLREELNSDLGSALQGAFPFAGLDCERLTDQVMALWLV